MSKQQALEVQTEPPSILGMIERAARDETVDVEKMRALLEMHEHIIKRNSEAAFNAAYAEMQAEMPEIDEGGQIKHGDRVISRYALFEDINKTVKPILQKHGFAVMFKTPNGERGVTVEGVLMHREGHRESTSMTLDADTSGSKNAVQSIGSSVSYAKRYLLCALLNITTRGEDDDGLRGGTQMVSAKQVQELRELCLAVDDGQEARLCKYFKCATLEQLPAAKFNNAMAGLTKKIKDAA